MTSFVHVQSDNNDIFRKEGGHFNLMLILWMLFLVSLLSNKMFEKIVQNIWRNCGIGSTRNKGKYQNFFRLICYCVVVTIFKF